MWVIEGRHSGRQLLLPALVFAPEPVTDLTNVAVAALIDTGSTISGITTEVAERLGLVGVGKRPLASARGEDQAERYVVRLGVDRPEESGAAFPYIFSEIIAFELRNAFAFQALIGMDILSQCDFSMERSGRWSLRFG